MMYDTNFVLEKHCFRAPWKNIKILFVPMVIYKVLKKSVGKINVVGVLRAVIDTIEKLPF